MFFFKFVGIMEWIRKNFRFILEYRVFFVWDFFRGYLIDVVKDFFFRRNVDVVVIFGGLILVL